MPSQISSCKIKQWEYERPYGMWYLVLKSLPVLQLCVFDLIDYKNGDLKIMIYIQKKER